MFLMNARFYRFCLPIIWIVPDLLFKIMAKKHFWHLVLYFFFLILQRPVNIRVVTLKTRDPYVNGTFNTDFSIFKPGK